MRTDYRDERSRDEPCGTRPDWSRHQPTRPTGCRDGAGEIFDISDAAPDNTQCEIVVLSECSRDYVNNVKRRLTEFGVSVAVIALRKGASLSETVQDMVYRRVLYAIIVHPTNVARRSISVKLLCSQPPQDYRSIPLEEGLQLVLDNYIERCRLDEEMPQKPDSATAAATVAATATGSAHTGLSARAPPPSMAKLMHFVLENRSLSVEEYDSLIRYLEECQRDQLSAGVTDERAHEDQSSTVRPKRSCSADSWSVDVNADSEKSRKRGREREAGDWETDGAIEPALDRQYVRPYGDTFRRHNYRSSSDWQTPGHNRDEEVHHTDRSERQQQHHEQQWREQHQQQHHHDQQWREQHQQQRHHDQQWREQDQQQQYHDQQRPEQHQQQQYHEQQWPEQHQDRADRSERQQQHHDEQWREKHQQQHQDRMDRPERPQQPHHQEQQQRRQQYQDRMDWPERPQQRHHHHEHQRRQSWTENRDDYAPRVRNGSTDGDRVSAAPSALSQYGPVSVRVDSGADCRPTDTRRSGPPPAVSPSNDRSGQSVSRGHHPSDSERHRPSAPTVSDNTAATTAAATTAATTAAATTTAAAATAAADSSGHDKAADGVHRSSSDDQGVEPRADRQTEDDNANVDRSTGVSPTNGTAAASDTGQAQQKTTAPRPPSNSSRTPSRQSRPILLPPLPPRQQRPMFHGGSGELAWRRAPQMAYGRGVRMPLRRGWRPGHWQHH